MTASLRIFWFSPTPSLYESKYWGHNGGGWISSLQKIVQDEPDVKLAIAFEYKPERHPEVIDAVKYYPIYIKNRIEDRYNHKKKAERLIQKSLEYINDFKPDIIQLFGSESWYGLLVNYIKIPIVIHMQGSLPSYYNARYPAGMSVWNKIFSFKTTFWQKTMAFRIDETFRKNAIQEVEIIKANRYFMGRTHWDKAIVEFYNPNAKYFVCQEALRDIFIVSGRKWYYTDRTKIKLISVISGPLYKGVDVVLKTARLLKEYTSLDFEWNICGISNIDLFENIYKIKAKEANVRLLGVLPQEKLLEQLIGSTFYIHPSYIENSPNSICEAQILGLPVVATNVGGVSSLVEDNKTGFLVPANDPLIIASLIVRYRSDQTTLKRISNAAIETATLRHDPEQIKNELLTVYGHIVNQTSKK